MSSPLRKLQRKQNKLAQEAYQPRKEAGSIMPVVLTTAATSFAVPFPIPKDVIAFSPPMLIAPAPVMPQITVIQPLKKIIVFVNLPQRDMQSDQILGNHLRKLGYEVRVVDFLPRNRDHILFYKPDVIILPELRCEYTINMAATFMAWGGIAIAKRTEGGICKEAWPLVPQEEQETVIGAWSYDCDMEIVWSEDFKDLMLKHGYLPKEKIAVVGGVPFDAYFEGPPVVKPKNRRNILFAPGWGHCDRSRDYNIPESPPGSPLHRDAYDRHKKGRDAWLDMIDKCIDKLYNWDFFIRPKVGEDPNAYGARFGNKVRVVFPCPAKIALENTDLLIHAGSTMGIEAHLMNMPALSFYGRLNQAPDYNFPNPNPDFEDSDKLIEAIKTLDLTKSNANTDNIKKLEHDFYGSIDGKACERTAIAIRDCINRIEAEGQKDPTKKRVLNIPDVWPPSPKGYFTPGVGVAVENWVCECCKNLCFIVREIGHEKEMIKCPNCGISLAKRGTSIGPIVR